MRRLAHKLWRAALGLTAAFCLGLPAWATPGAWSAVVAGGGPPLSVFLMNEQSGTATTAFATVVSNACAIGSGVVVWARHTVTAIPVTSVTDSKGNTYALVNQQTGVAPATVFAYAKNITALTGADTVTVNTGATSGNESVAFACVVGMQSGAPLDQSIHNVTGTGTTLSTSSGVLAKTNEIVFGGVALSGGSASTACNGSFSRLTGGGTPVHMLCAQIVSATSSVAFAPSWASSVNYQGDAVTFKGW